MLFYLKIANTKLILIENISIYACDRERGREGRMREGGKNERSRETRKRKPNGRSCLMLHAPRPQGAEVTSENPQLFAGGGNWTDQTGLGGQK